MAAPTASKPIPPVVRASSAEPELVHVTAADAALAEFDAEDVLSRACRQPAQGPGVAAVVENGARLGRGTVVAAAVFAVAVVLVTMGTLREARSTPPGAAGASVMASMATRAPAASGRELSGPALSGPALSGPWRLTSRIADASLPRFRGLVLGYELRLEQDGNRLHGAGVKASENGRPLSSRARTPISVEGTIDGQTVRLAFTESGLARTSRGAFSLRLASDGSLSGGFWSDAARSTGTVTATATRLD